MKTIRTLNELGPYGVRPRNTAACALGYRVVCDLTAKGRWLLATAFGLPAGAAASPEWYGLGPCPGEVGTALLPPEASTCLAIFALLDDGCREAWLLDDGTVRGVEPGDDPRSLGRAQAALGPRLIRTFGRHLLAAPGATSPGTRGVDDDDLTIWPPRDISAILAEARGASGDRPRVEPGAVRPCPAGAVR